MNNRVGIISPSNILITEFPNRFEQGLKNLEELGFKTVLSNNHKRKNSYTKESVNERLKELNEILNSDVDTIIASIGGYLSIQLLDQIDYNFIKEKNITFCGCSDISALLLAIYTMTGKTVLYGPTYTVNFCDYDGIDEYTLEYFCKCLEKKDIQYQPSSYEYKDFIDWGVLENEPQNRKKTKKANDWQVIKKGTAKGHLLGGNLATILLILGSKYLPVENFKDKVLFLEDCETNTNEFCSYLEALRINGIFDSIKGVIVGKFDSDAMNKEMPAFLENYFQDYDFPVACNIDFGHVSPMITIPIGEECELNCDKHVNFRVQFKEEDK